MRNYFLAGVVGISALLAGCKACTQLGEASPAAQTPDSPNVISVLKRGDGWTNVGANGAGAFEILPGAYPKSGVRLHFRALYPAAVRVAIDGTSLPDFRDVPAGTDPATTGYYRVLDIRANQNPSLWQVAVRPPDSKLSSKAYQLEVFHISVNPKFPSGPDHESAPLVIQAAAQKNFTLTVVVDGPNQARVISIPPGIDCGADCSEDFGPSTTVQLYPSAGKGFTGWSGACSGTGACSVTLNGEATTVTASFSGGNSGQPATCPSPAIVPGFSYAGKGLCASNDPAGHPTADWECDAQGHFCCEDAQGINDPRCKRPDRRQFPADCIRYGPMTALKQPYGCYTKDNSLP